MRRAVVIIAMTLALFAAGVAVAFAIGAGLSRPAPSDGTHETDAAAPVTAEDYCYVEAMIYYRVSESRLAKTIVARDDIGEDTKAFAGAAAERADAELEDLREWYLQWRDARPAEPPVEGPCAGHGADHAEMPGTPSFSRREDLAAARGVEAERLFAEMMREQNAGMLAFVDLVLAGDPHPRVRESAAEVRERAAADDAALDELGAASR